LTYFPILTKNATPFRTTTKIKELPKNEHY